MTPEPLKFRKIWLVIGYLLIATVIYSSLLIKMPRIGHGDKLMHLLTYGILMWWFAQLYPPGRRWLFAVAFIILGVGLEFLQPLTNRYRVLDYSDMAANSGGVFIGWLSVRSPLAHSLRRIEQRWGER